jgi:hypothetical protein
VADENELAGFCFRCSAKDPRFDPDSHIPIHNPWPMLAPSHALDYMRSQPLVRVFYSPVPFTTLSSIRAKRLKSRTSRITAADRADFLDWFNWLHEYTHLWQLEWTPAKEVAKTYLATSYALIHMLMYDDKPSDWLAERVWDSFRRCTLQVARIVQNIGFVEELFATAIALRDMEEQMQPGGMWAGFEEELETLKAQSIEQEEAIFPRFREQYERIKPLVQLMRDPVIRAGITPLLQPVKYPDNAEPFAVDTRENLNRILQLTDAGDHVEVNATRLRPLAQEVASEWRLALGLQIEYARTPLVEEGGRRIVHGQFAKSLWNISRGQFDDTIEEVPSSFKFLDALQQGNWLGSNLIMLTQEVYRRRGIIGANWFPVIDTPLPEEVQAEHFEVLFFEGLRQQILIRKGFVCPFSKGRVHCRCKSTIRKGLMRLAAFAEDGVFGPGEWSPLPCKR